MSAEKARLYTYIKAPDTKTPNVCDSTNRAIMAILNTSNQNRYRTPVLIRFDTDSAYVILQPSDFTIKTLGLDPAQRYGTLIRAKTSAEVAQPDGHYKALNAVWVG
ncbi:hypothetical protein Q8A73_023065 [Channa argus]|nr:hypothetical protein Q8A73_023065 [Channa argus]